jgi:hypothetical protein
MIVGSGADMSAQDVDEGCVTLKDAVGSRGKGETIDGKERIAMGLLKV